MAPYEAHETFQWSAQDCDAALALFLPDYSAVRDALPAGFAPADAAYAIGGDVAPGRALVMVAMLQCFEGTSVSDDLLHSTTAVLVAPPKGSDDSEQPSQLHFYDVSHTATGWLWEELSFRGWTAHLAGQTLQIDDGIEITANVTTPYVAEMTYVEEGGVIDGTVVTGTTYAETNWDIVIWRVTGDRMLAMHLDYEQAPLIGAVECTFGDSPAVQQFLPESQQQCTGTVVAIGAILPGFDFVATLRDEGPWP